MSDAGRKSKKLFGIPLKIEPNLSVPVRDRKEQPHAVPVRPEPIRHDSYERPPGSITVDWYPGRKP